MGRPDLGPLHGGFDRLSLGGRRSESSLVTGGDRSPLDDRDSQRRGLRGQGSRRPSRGNRRNRHRCRPDQRGGCNVEPGAHGSPLLHESGPPRGRSSLCWARSTGARPNRDEAARSAEHWAVERFGVSTPTARPIELIGPKSCRCTSQGTDSPRWPLGAELGPPPATGFAGNGSLGGSDPGQQAVHSYVRTKELAQAILLPLQAPLV
jgi:hypothetical protein